MNQHRLIVDPKVIEWDYKSTKDFPAEQANAYRLFYQMTRLTKDRGSLIHDDRIDCLSIAVNYWVEQMASDIEEAMNETRAEALEKELTDFVGMGKRGMKALILNEGMPKITLGTWM